MSKDALAETREVCNFAILLDRDLTYDTQPQASSLTIVANFGQGMEIGHPRAAGLEACSVLQYHAFREG